MHTGTTAADDTVEMPPTPPDRRVPERPVFVDASGRRQRLVRRLGRILVVPAVAYIGLLVSTLLGGPTINSPFLPLPAPPHSASDQGHGGGSGAGQTTAGAPGSAGTGAGAGGGANGQGATGGTPTKASAPGVTAGATPAATRPGVAHGRDKHTASPPGASHHPTKKARP